MAGAATASAGAATNTFGDPPSDPGNGGNYGGDDYGGDDYGGDDYGGDDYGGDDGGGSGDEENSPW